MLEQYLIHCYLYYHLDSPIISDEKFDKLCKDLLAAWDTIDHPYKDLVTPRDLKAGSGYAMMEYPDKIKRRAERMLQTFESNLPKHPYSDRGVTTNVGVLMKTLIDVDEKLLLGLRKDYNYYLSGDHRRMAINVIDQILEGRNGRKSKV